MGLFRRQPSSEEKRDINALLSRAQTCTRNINEADNINVFFREWEKLNIYYKQLLAYEKSGVRFNPSISKTFELDVFNKKKKVEFNCINRAFDRLQVSILSLNTIQGKRNRINAFYDEVEFYSNKMNPENVEYIKALKHTLLNDIPVEETKIPPISFCPYCGEGLDREILFALTAVAAYLANGKRKGDGQVKCSPQDLVHIWCTKKHQTVRSCEKM